MAVDCIVGFGMVMVPNRQYQSRSVSNGIFLRTNGQALIHTLTCCVTGTDL